MNRDELEEVLLDHPKYLSWEQVIAALDEYTREVKAAALREAANTVALMGTSAAVVDLRDRADHTAKEADR